MFLKYLNANQREAVTTLDTPLIIVAGPGTGKTRVLTYKIAYLIKKGISPYKILALTFTKKAAYEMQERVKKLVSHKKDLPFIGTFHSFAYQFLNNQDKTISLINEEEKQEIIKEIKNKYQLKESLKDLNLIISNSKNKIAGEKQEDWLQAYNDLLKAKDLIDYDDLLLRLYDALTKNQTIKYDYLYVDEFQDTNTIQYELVKKLLGTNNICVIGDPLQCIYAFRGSNVNFFEQFIKDFPNHKSIFLTTNYRSGEKIIAASHALFPSSNTLIPLKQNPSEVSLISTFNEYSEADWIVDDINKKLGGLDLNLASNIMHHEHLSARFSDFAVIYRTHMLKNIIKNKLYKSGIPYQIIGEGTPFNEEKIRLIILSLKYLVNEDLKYLTEISKILKIKDVVISEKLRTLRKTSDLNQIIAGLLNFFNIHCNQTESLQEFINSSLPYSKSANGLTDFVEYIKYLEDHEFYDARADKVTLLTIHAAKGLEFSHVYLIGFNEDIMPLIDAHFENVEEEKRLCYVAMTRAKDTLTLITTVKRFGNKKNISPFSILLESQVEKITDPEINKIKKKIEKRKIKQVSLFDP